MADQGRQGSERGDNVRVKRQGPRRPEVRAQENRTFLRALARTGNVKASAAEAGVPQETMHRRRQRDADFAARWQEALGAAAWLLSHAPPGDDGLQMPAGAAGALKTSGAERVIRTGVGGRVQIRRARRGSLTQAAVQHFLKHLAATGNVTEAAAATGFHSSPFYALAVQDQEFAAAWRQAVQFATEQLESKLLRGFVGPMGDEWLEEVEELPPVSAAEALRLLRFHHEKYRREEKPRRSSVEEATKRLHKVLLQLKVIPRDAESWGPGRGERD